MKPNLSVDNIKNETKRYNSSTDIQSILNRKTSTCKKENNKDKDNDYNKNNDFICNHNSNFISFCESCSLDLCSECEKNHINHKIIKFNDIIPNKEEINKINNTIKKYSEDYSKLIEEIYNWKKDLDKKIFYFEEQIKNNNIINKNLEYVQNFDFSKNNKYSYITRYIKISELITKSEKNNDTNINDDINVGCYMYQNYINSKQILEKIKEYKNDFLMKSNDIIKLILSFLSENKVKNKNVYIKETKYLSPINKEKFKNNHFFSLENTFNNNIYNLNNKNNKESNINEININYLTSENINNSSKENNFNNHSSQKNLKNLESQKMENQSKSIGNIFLDGQNELFINNKNNKIKYIKIKNDIIKSSTLRTLNAINSKNVNDYQNKEFFFNKKKKNDSNNVNYVNTKLNKKLNPNFFKNDNINNKNEDILNTNNSNNDLIINKYVPKIKRQNRVYNINNISHNLNTMNSYINTSHDKNKVYKHKKLNSVSTSNYINQSLHIDYNTNYNNNTTDYDSPTILSNSISNYSNLLKPMNLEQIRNNFNSNLDNKNDYNMLKTNMNQIYPIYNMEKNSNPSLYYSLQDSINFSINNKRTDIKKKLLNKNKFNQNFNTILETPITFTSKLNSENNTLKYNKSDNNFNEFNINKKDSNFCEENIINNNDNAYLIDGDKNLFLGLELGNNECRIGIANQNNYNNIDIFNFDINNKETKNTIPTIISFDNKSNDIKIGYEAENNIINNPSQTIFNILKLIGKTYNQINNDIDLWPFKLYYNEDLCRPYVKINYNKQKNRIFFFEDLLSIYLKKLFEIFFSRIKLMNNNSNIINLILVVTVPNNYNYLQRKIIEKIFQTQIFPQIKGDNISDNIGFENKKNFSYKSNINNMIRNKKNFILYFGHKIILKDIKIENASSVAPLCLFNNKIKFKINIENNESDSNKKKNININMKDNKEELFGDINATETNNEFNSNNRINTTNKINDKYILVINIDGGYTNISLVNSYQNKLKEKNNNNNSKFKNAKSLKKNNLNILEVKELSGIEYGEEDFTDIYINDSLKKFDENIYKDILKSPKELAQLRQNVLIAKKYFISSKESITINIPQKFLDLNIDLNINDYEKSCQEIFTKIISMIKSLLKKSKLSEKNIDMIILIASTITTNNFSSLLKNIFINSKIIYNNCNDYIAIGAAMQAVNNNILKPLYKFIDITNMNFGIETLNGIMETIIPKGLKIPVQKIKYVKIKNNDYNIGESPNHLNKYLEINIFEGDNKFVKNNRLISCANIDKRNFKGEKIGNGFIEILVEFEINIYSNLSVYVLDINNFKRRFECLTNLDMVKG